MTNDPNNNWTEVGSNLDLSAADTVPTEKPCGCLNCTPVENAGWFMLVCTECGNKRCPHATFHEHACSGENIPLQKGSSYGQAPCDDVDCESKYCQNERLRETAKEQIV